MFSHLIGWHALSPRRACCRKARPSRTQGVPPDRAPVRLAANGYNFTGSASSGWRAARDWHGWMAVAVWAGFRLATLVPRFYTDPFPLREGPRYRSSIRQSIGFVNRRLRVRFPSVASAMEGGEGRWPSGQWHQTVNLTDSVLRGFESLPAQIRTIESAGRVNNAGVAQLAELQPSKLDVEGSNPFTRSWVGASRLETARQNERSLLNRGRVLLL